MASELRRSILFFRQTFRSGVDGAVLCGDAPSLRALTSPLADALNVPIQTLDSLSGIDANRVPEPADTFRADVASLRLAIAAGAEATTHANLLPAAIREARETRSTATRSVAALAAGLLIVAGWYSLVAGSASATSDVQDLERRIAILEPQSATRAELQRTSSISARQDAALFAFDSQGPRLARILELLSRETPGEIALTTIDVQADGGHWRTTIHGLAVTPDVAAGQGAVNRLLQRLSESPLVGPVVQPPSFKLVSGASGGRATAAGEVRAIPDDLGPVVPAGTTGVQFTMQFKVPR
jgi:hypothetical protein